MLFQTGVLVQTVGIEVESGENPEFAVCVMKSLDRHKKGDWGDLEEETKYLNDEAIEEGGRILSAYNLLTREGIKKIYIITECDRSVTSVLFASEY